MFAWIKRMLQRIDDWEVDRMIRQMKAETARENAKNTDRLLVRGVNYALAPEVDSGSHESD